MKQDNHFFLGGLEEGTLNVWVEEVHFVSLHGGVAEAIAVSLKNSLCVCVCIVCVGECVGGNDKLEPKSYSTVWHAPHNVHKVHTLTHWYPPWPDEWSHVEIFESWVTLGRAQHQSLLLHIALWVWQGVGTEAVRKEHVHACTVYAFVPYKRPAEL